MKYKVELEATVQFRLQVEAQDSDTAADIAERMMEGMARDVAQKILDGHMGLRILNVEEDKREGPRDWAVDPDMYGLRSLPRDVRRILARTAAGRRQLAARREGGR